MTDPALYQQAKRIFQTAADLTGHERTAYIRSAVQNNQPLEQLVNDLLAGDDSANSGVAAKLEDGAIHAISENDSTHPTSVSDILDADLRDPEQIGKYRIVRRIAEGGMGIVYEATSENPIRRVALKIVRSANLTAAARRRFQFEIDILAKLEHTGIGRLYDAGTTQTSSGDLQYLAMEYIDGVDLRTHAENHELTARDRLRLIAAVSDAVHYAHQKGVIHRDLKPQNILVDRQSQQPRILDFGVARFTDSDRQRATMTTDVGQLIGTLSYMSPEQLESDDNDVDVRTDVYALGVILFELLTGTSPYNIRGKSIIEAGRIIRETDAPSLSAIDKMFAGDIETIVAKALDKNRTARYQSAADLAADIRNHLSDRPITAKPPTLTTTAIKFAKRHTGLVAGITVATIALIAATIVSTSMAISESRLRTIAEAQTQRAETEAAKSGAVVAFLQDMFASVSPEHEGQKDLSVLEFLDASADQAMIESTIANQTTRAAILRVLGNAYTELGYQGKALPLLEDASELLTTVPDVDPDDMTETLSLLTRAKTANTDLEGAESLANAVIQRCLDMYGQHNLQTALAYHNLAMIHTEKGEYGKSEQLHRKALAIREKLGTPRNVATSLNSLADSLHRQSRLEESLTFHRRALQIRRENLDPDHPRIAASLNNLGSLLQEMERLDEAEEMLLESLETRERIYPANHPLIALSYNNLGTLYMVRRDFVSARSALQKTIDIHRALGQENHPNVARTMTNLANVLSNLGDNVATARMQADALQSLRAQLGPDHPNVAMAMHNAGWYQHKAGQTENAIATLNTATEILESRLGPNHGHVAHFLHTTATFHTQLMQYDDAVRLVRRSLETRKSVFPDDHPAIAATEHDLATVLLMSGQPTNAKPHIAEAVTRRRTTSNEPEPNTRLLSSLLLNSHIAIETESDPATLAEAEQVLAKVSKPNSWAAAYANYLRQRTSPDAPLTRQACESLEESEGQQTPHRRFVIEQCHTLTSGRPVQSR